MLAYEYMRLQLTDKRTSELVGRQSKVKHTGKLSNRQGKIEAGKSDMKKGRG
jgi:hypothetical protein